MNQIKNYQFLLDASLFGEDPWAQEAIKYRENLRENIWKIRGKK